MASHADANFPARFLNAVDLPAGMNCYGDRRDGLADPDDPAFARHGGRRIGMTKWEGQKDSALQAFVEIRWLFPDPRSATAYHLATLQAKAEGKPEDPAAKTVGDDCHVYTYFSGQELGAAQELFSRALGNDHQMTRGMDRAIAAMPDDAFIYLFTRGPVAVKCVAVLSPSSAGRETGAAVVYGLAVRIDRSLSGGSRKATPWWKRFLGA